MSAVWLMLIVPATSVLYDILAYHALREWMSEPPVAGDRPPEPITFFRPVKRGVPQLREKLEMLVRASLPGDQILLGADADSEEAEICKAVRRAFPGRDVEVVPCRPGAAVNPKISKLVQMEPQARHASWLLSDSEVILTHGFLPAFRGEWKAHGEAALTAPYRFVNLVSGPHRCDALGPLLGLWPGLALLRKYGRIHLTLGACTLVRRDALESVGGWGAFGHELAEDQRLGEALGRAGFQVRLSRQVATLDSDPMSWGDYWRHQRRVAVTYRAASPVGFAGSFLTFGPVWALACLLVFRGGSFFAEALVLTCAVRGWRIGKMAHGPDFRVPWRGAALLIASLVEPVCWALSWLTTTVWWSGRRWRVDSRGKLSAIDAGGGGATALPREY
jgi:ceramide glucosyltransferase